MTSAARVLVAASPPSVADVIREVLELDGYALTAVDDVATLATALETAWAVDAPYRVVVTQARVGADSVFDTLRAARRGGVRPRTVVLSTDASQDVYYEAYRLQCICVLPLPFDPNEFRRIVALLARDDRG